MASPRIVSFFKDVDAASRRSRLLGVTEAVWKAMPEERKLAWKLANWAAATIATLFVAKTGIRLVDVMSGALCGLTSLAIIESQRNLGKYGLRFRRRLLRVAVGLAALVPSIILALYFLGSVALLARGVADEMANSAAPGHGFSNALVAACYAFALPVAALNVFRGTQFRALMVDEPRKWAFKLIAHRRFIARCDAECFFFEGAVLALSTASLSTLNGFLALFVKSLVQ